MTSRKFETSVFVNCPFDEDYAPILQAILFCIIYLGYHPRIATENIDFGTNRLEKIINLIENSKLSVHDLSRCQAATKGEYFRLNMPFELGIDFGCRRFFGKGRSTKVFLILEEQDYRYQAALSDIAGLDIRKHEGDFEVAIEEIRHWLVANGCTKRDGPARITGAYVAFQEWHYEKQRFEGFSDEDIQKYPTAELLAAMIEWNSGGRPASYP